MNKNSDNRENHKIKIWFFEKIYEPRARDREKKNHRNKGHPHQSYI